MRKLQFFAAALLVSGTAAAEWVSESKVTRLKVHSAVAPYELELWLDKIVASSCTHSSRVKLLTTDSELFEAVRHVAISAQASQRNVEIDTNGCEGDHGKLNYISLK